MVANGHVRVLVYFPEYKSTKPEMDIKNYSCKVLAKLTTEYLTKVAYLFTANENCLIKKIYIYIFKIAFMVKS